MLPIDNKEIFLNFITTKRDKGKSDGTSKKSLRNN